ncbi:hypothetical protein F5Y14DRAFT_431442 [Nemania sp. NC0429]|nr:hypothetical protein F5Y14DRAFT_431442 [Nemania sp. NC0429]
MRLFVRGGRAVIRLLRGWVIIGTSCCRSTAIPSVPRAGRGGAPAVSAFNRPGFLLQGRLCSDQNSIAVCPHASHQQLIRVA